MRPDTPLAVENGVGKLAAPLRRERQMPARERERGELPSPNLSLLDRKVEQGLIVFAGQKMHLLKMRVRTNFPRHLQ